MEFKLINLTTESELSLLRHLKRGVSKQVSGEIVSELLERAHHMDARKQKIKELLAGIEADERLGYPTATVFENAPLALIQCGLENQVRALKHVLKILNGELDKEEQ